MSSFSSMHEYVKCSTGDKPPEDAVEGGFDNGPSYHARGIVSGKTIPGKVGVLNGLLKGACIPYGGKENRINHFEVLTLKCNGSFSYGRCKTGDKPPENAVQGGYDEGPSYHAKGIVDGKEIPGKVGVTRKHDGNLKGACIAYGGKEHRINDFKVLLSQDTITRVEFHIDQAKMLSTAPKVIASEENNNDSHNNQSIEFSYSETVTHSFTFTHQAGVKVSIGGKASFGIPLVAEGGNEVKLGATYTYTWGNSNTNSKTYSAKFPVVASPKTIVICEAVVNETKLDVPYTLHLRSGRKVSGKWKGTSTWGLKATFKEKQL